MNADAQAAALESVQWEADRRRAAMEFAQQRADAADIRRQQQEAEREAEDRPRPDPEMAAFMQRMTGAPPPLDFAGVLAKVAMLTPAADEPGRDPHAEYGSTRNPAVFVNGREVAEPVRRSSDWPGSEAEVDQLLARNRELNLWMIDYQVRHDYQSALARARAKQDSVVRRYADDDYERAYISR